MPLAAISPFQPRTALGGRRRTELGTSALETRLWLVILHLKRNYYNIEADGKHLQLKLGSCGSGSGNECDNGAAAHGIYCCPLPVSKETEWIPRILRSTIFHDFYNLKSNSCRATSSWHARRPWVTLGRTWTATRPLWAGSVAQASSQTVMATLMG